MAVPDFITNIICVRTEHHGITAGFYVPYGRLWNTSNKKIRKKCLSRPITWRRTDYEEKTDGYKEDFEPYWMPGGII